VDDVMVKDPYCQAYFPERNGLPLEIDGQRLLFCSPECRDAYRRQRQAQRR
jgi:YHS domain-containing protein